jgi:para-aminobenzoate synthetase / 4-amino-4-deoxychorismate lyase
MSRWHSLPAEVYALVEQTPATVLLETSKSSAQPSLSRLFIAPLRVIEARESGDLPDLFAQIEAATRSGHFAAGFFAYECGQVFEPKVAREPGDADRLLAWIGIYERSYCFDHAAGAFIDGDPPGLANATIPQPLVTSARSGLNAGPIGVTPTLTENEYADRIHDIHEWIRAGDVYQINFTFPLEMSIGEHAAGLYARLRGRQPVEYGAFLHCYAGRHILCFSPELFFHVEQRGASRYILAKPMKGTARRGRTAAEDAQVAEWLRNDGKNRSENVMIVDLIRNDLGRLCEFGSVHVQSLFEVERFPTLWQMTSTVTGELRSGVGFHEIFRALFPCGSITGAPKIRAMQLLAQIEKEPRGVYTGSIGYFSRERTVFNVAIRVLELNGEKAKMGVGGGIVIDSDAAEEFRECELKAEFLTGSEEPFSLVETLLWQDKYPLLAMHLSRLEDSADYFGFIFDRAKVEAELLTVADTFPRNEPHKVRLLISSDGSLDIEQEAIHEAADAELPAHACIAPQRTDPSDRFLFHKTTHRPLYLSAVKTAKEAGFVDALFLNMRGEVTEGAISNIFIEKDGRWFTPPVECGLLPGVYRRYMLETRSDMEEKILYLDDLKTADAVYLTNAVRGLRRVIIYWEN